MLQNKVSEESFKKIVFKLINGSLRGCEFLLPPGKTLFIVSGENEISHHNQGTISSENAIFIPSRNPGCNFEIIVSEDANAVTLREIQEEGFHETITVPHEIFIVGDQKFAWRHEGEDFLGEAFFSSESEVEKSSVSAKTEGEVQPASKFWWCKILFVLAILTCISYGAYTIITETDRKINSVSDYLSSSAGNYHVIYGKDKKIYIMAFSEQAAQWAIQTMVRSKKTEETQILTTRAEELRITKWIEANWAQVKSHRVILNNPEIPIIEISRERSRLDEKQQKDFIHSVLENMPYAKKCRVKKVSDARLKAKARDGLNKLAQTFAEMDNKESVTFVIQGAIEDGELERVKKFIKDYYQTWGGEYVQFAVELKDDRLKGKSFKYGDQGYIKISPGHWHFSGNLN